MLLPHCPIHSMIGAPTARLFTFCCSLVWLLVVVVVVSPLMAVTFSRPNEDGINVFIRNVNGKTRCLWVDPYNEPVGVIKKRLLLDTAARDNDNVIWMWNGKPLEDENVLADYGPTNNGMTIHALYALKGGCFMVSLSIVVIIIIAVVGSMCTCGLSLVVVPFLMPLLFVLPLFCL